MAKNIVRGPAEEMLKGVNVSTKPSGSPKVNGEAICLGYFDTPEEGGAAYIEAAKKYHGEFMRAA